MKESMGQAARKVEMEFREDHFRRSTLRLVVDDSITRLKKFGHVMGLVFAVLGALGLLRGSRYAPIFVALSCLFTAGSILVPRALEPIERVWLAFGEKMSRVMTFVLLTFAYFLVITPMGLLVRVMGKDLLKLKLDPNRESYWEPVDNDGPASRPYQPY